MKDDARVGNLFTTPVDRTLYELATCSDTSDSDYLPAPEALTRLLTENRIAVWNSWRGMVLRDNVVFLGTRDSQFNRDVLVHNVENDYFHLYIFCLYQKMRLQTFAGELVRKSEKLQRNLKEARHLWDAFMTFRNYYWFTDVTQKALGGELYAAFQRGLGVLSLYQSVSEEVRDLQEYYERKAERRLGNALNFLAFIGLPAGVLSQLFGNALIQKASWSEFLLVTVIVYGAIGIGWLLWRWIEFGRD